MSGVRVPAFAKINLCLDVLGKRPDGYHELRTIFQTISLRDTLSWRGSPHAGSSWRSAVTRDSRRSHPGRIWCTAHSTPSVGNCGSGAAFARNFKSGFPRGADWVEDQAMLLLRCSGCCGSRIARFRSTGWSRSAEISAPTSHFSCLAAGPWGPGVEMRFIRCLTRRSAACW